MKMPGPKPRKIVLAVLLIVIPMAILVWVGYQVWYTDQLKAIDADYCPEGNAQQKEKGFVSPGHTAILIDTSNKIPQEDAERAFQRISAWTRDRNSVPLLQKLSIYGLPESVNARVVSSSSHCIPKGGEEAEQLYENPVYVEARFLRFLGELQKIFQGLVAREEAPHSPILETMDDLVQRHEDIDSIVLVSDMLQHTHLWSHYDGEGDMSGISPTCDRVGNAGQLKAVYVYYIDRGHPDQEWPDPRWDRCLSGVEIVRMN